jgi:N-acyl-D-aspartate/D-glutamate deacylase
LHPIYLDAHATTPVDERVVQAMLPFFTERFGNAASRHQPFGWQAGKAVEQAREQVASLIGAPDRGVATDMSWLADSVPAEELKKLQEGATDRPDAQKAYGIQARNLAKIHAAGVKIVLGTDGGIPWSHHVEMADMVAAGMSPSDVIVASTKNAAEFLRLDEAGTVAAGKRADFLVLEANPLDDITNTRKIASVYLRGAAVDRAAIGARMTGRATN